MASRTTHPGTGPQAPCPFLPNPNFPPSIPPLPFFQAQQQKESSVGGSREKTALQADDFGISRIKMGLALSEMSHPCFISMISGPGICSPSHKQRRGRHRRYFKIPWQGSKQMLGSRAEGTVTELQGEHTRSSACRGCSRHTGWVLPRGSPWCQTMAQTSLGAWGGTG